MQWLLICGSSASGIHAIPGVLHQEVMHSAYREGVPNLAEEEECVFPSLMTLYNVFSFLLSFFFPLLIRLFGSIYCLYKLDLSFFFVLVFFFINGSIAIFKDQGLVQTDFPVAVCLL